MQIDLHKFEQLKYFSTTIFVSQFFVFTMIMKTRPWRHIYHDIWIPRPKHHNIKIPRPRNHNIEIRGLKHHGIKKCRQISHDIVTPRRFFRGQKATTSRFQD